MLKLNMHEKRRHTRHIIKLPAEIIAGGVSIKGTTVRISRRGCFVRSQRSFQEGTPIELAVALADNINFRLKGTVKYARNINYGPLSRQNGMGIEFLQVDPDYSRFVESVDLQD